MRLQSPRILHVASEAFPLAKSGGLGDVIGALPGALRARGESTAVCLPAYPWIRALTPVPVDTRLEIAVPSAGGVMRGRLFRTVLPTHDVPAILIRLGDLFERPELYGEGRGDYPDNPFRFGLFCRAVLEATRVLGWAPEIFHVHDWHAALVPVFLRTRYARDPRLSAAASVLTIHNLAFQGHAPPSLLSALDLPASLHHPEALEFWGRVNLLKGGILFADRVNAVSPRYADEILSPEYGHGLDGVLRARAQVLSGVLNGVDPAVWDPGGDRHLPRTYGIDDWPQGKAAARRTLEQEFGLVRDPARPLIAFIGRLTPQKGVDLLVEIVPDLVAAGARMVLIGTGSPALEQAWRAAAARFPGSVAVKITYRERLAHLIQAGADMLVMASRFEPCGLNQLYAMRYGTVPIVHPVGGLRDSVTPLTDDPAAGSSATGFWFQDLSREQLIATFGRALAAWRDRATWARIVTAAMRRDFTWDRSAQAYQALYVEARRAASAAPSRSDPSAPSERD